MLSFDKSIDPRSGWELFRRKELYWIAQQENVSFTHGCPANTLKTILSETNIDPRKYRPQKLGMLHGEADTKYNYQKEEKTEEEPVTMKVEMIYIENMKMNEVRKYLTEHGVKWMMKNKKVELIQMAKDFQEQKDG